MTWTKITRGLAENAPVNVVREDPIRKGLLFAGTEREVYVSFNDGDVWQPITLNLPHSSMRDLVVHHEDLIVATHGRSFWILDNITPLRQISAAGAGADTYLYKPASAWRIRRNNNTDTPLPPEVPAGRNPPDGAIIDYYLREPASGAVTLEIFTAAGGLVRRYSSADKPEPHDKEINVPTYWVRQPTTLSADKGMHRFVWDLHYPPPEAIEHDYPISAIYMDTPRLPLGPAALPGVYTVKLTANGKSSTQPLAVTMDPRVKTSPLGLAQQFRLATRLTDMMHSDSEGLQQVRAARRQTGLSASTDPLAALDRDLTALNNNLVTVYDLIEGADARPTLQAAKTVVELEHTLTLLLARWAQLKR